MSDKPTPCIHGRNFCLECHCVKHEKANCQTCTEWNAAAPKPKCPVFGGTIPRGIPHEHPAGVSAVMRDPVPPLTDHERALADAFRHGHGFVMDGKHVPADSVFLVPDDAPMLPGRKLRDSLLMAGTSPTVRSTATVDGLEVVMEANYGPAPKSLDQRHDWHGITVSEWDEVRSLSVAQIAGRIATGIVLAVGVASILILSAMTAGWL